ncbi:cyclopropane-fatty-acyl-phospholipid synthase family protein [Streptomyces sp. NBC_00338]|uniref:SAM-dependent methyltransferase n=1 Tax=unclassified Streptomyces TaxID=2593676 RepID=UPI00225B839B|nr:class I SAM-dependent methyltransferase [Streptomyces sp. NBC_00338]MCX5144698.1 class I SAM-dependent methyltransferase [Streptomyces sp. NBC_00338]WSU57002.1 class I SAM-dependent methyltransferase [Streptomyces sp. NBC_01104]
MNHDHISALAHAAHPVKAPLDDDSVTRLLRHAVPHGEARALDLGCGGGEWLLRALDGHPGLRAEGVDISEGSLRLAGEAADRLGVRGRLVLHQQDGAAFTSQDPFDLVLSVGAAHVFGGLLPTLAAAREHLAPGGRVLIGDGYWEREPAPEAVEMLGDFSDLATTLDLVAADGWTPVHGHISSRGELDAYEWACWGSLASWALDNPAHPDSAEVLETAATRRTEWLRGYRETWGFVTLVLRSTSG